MSLIKRNLKCPSEKLVISRSSRHRYRLEWRGEFEGTSCVKVSPLDKGFQDFATAIWPEDWVYFPGQQMELFTADVLKA